MMSKNYNEKSIVSIGQDLSRVLWKILWGNIMSPARITSHENFTTNGIGITKSIQSQSLAEAMLK